MIYLIAAAILLQSTDSVAAARAKFAASLKYQTGDVQLKGGLTTLNAAKKLILVAVAAVAAFFRKLLGGKKKSPATPAT